MNPTTRLFPAACAATATLFLSCGSAFATTVTVGKVALSGEHPPGTPLDVTYSGFSSSATIGDSGQVGFQAMLTPGGSVTAANNVGAWIGAPDSSQLVAREGDPASGLPGAVFGSVEAPWMDSSGRVTFRGLASGSGVIPGQSDLGIWNGLPGALRLIVREGTTADGIPGVNYDTLRGYQVSRDGVIGISATLSGTGIITAPGQNNNAYGVWLSKAGGAPALAVRSGQLAPGANTNFTTVQLNGLGGDDSLLVYGNLFDSTTNTNFGSFIGPAGALNLVAKENTIPPGCPIDWVLDGISLLQANAGGAFYAPGIAEYDSFGHTHDLLYYGSSKSSLRLLATGGDILPGTGAPIFTIRAIGAGDDGRGLGFIHLVTDPSRDSVLCRYTPQGVTPVLQEGDPAPGQSDGALFGDFLDSNPYAMNHRGDCVFFNLLTTSNPAKNNDPSLWHLSTSGALTPLARRGDALQVAPGDVRIIEGIFINSNPADLDFKAPAFNDNGQVAVVLTFTDKSSGVFQFTVTPDQPVVPFAIQSISVTPDAVTLTVPVASGQTIGIEYSDSLSGDWSDLGDFIVSGGIGTFTDTDTTHLGNATGFYRAFIR